MISPAVPRPAKFRVARPAQTPAYWAATSFIGLILLANFLFGGEPYEMSGGLGNAAYQTCLLATFAAVMASTRFWVDPRRLLVLPLTIGLALLWCWLSMAWAIAPGVAVRRVAQLSILILACFTIVRQLGYERSIHLMRWTFGFSLVLSYVVLVVWPDFAIQRPHDSIESDAVATWRGIMMDKNANGAFCALTILLFVFDARSVPRWVRAVMIAAAAVLLWQSASKTAIGVLLGVIAIGGALLFYRPAYRLLLIPFVVCLVAGLALMWHSLLAPFQAALYDPNAFTGRGVIWAMLVQYAHDHWLLGSGYGSFWAIGDQSPVYQLAKSAWLLDRVRVGHNGYLDLVCQIGVPGLILVLLAVVFVPLARLFASRTITPQQFALLGSSLLFGVGNNFTESSLFDGKAVLSVAILMNVALIVDATRQRDPARRWSARAQAAARRRDDAGGYDGQAATSGN